jgi:hypothetical protein
MFARGTAGARIMPIAACAIHNHLDPIHRVASHLKVARPRRVDGVGDVWRGVGKSVQLPLRSQTVA